MTNSYKHVIVKLLDISCFFGQRGAMVEMLGDYRGTRS